MDDQFLPRKSPYWQQIMLGNTEKERHSRMTREVVKLIIIKSQLKIFQLQEKINYIDVTEGSEHERAQIYKKSVEEVEKIAKQWVF
jgi:hypothetical protein